MDYEKTRELIPFERTAHTVLFTNGCIRLMGRFTYAYVAESQKNENDEGKTVETWSSGILMPKNTHKDGLVLCIRRIREICADNKMKDIPSDKKFCKDGDKTDKEEYQNMWVATGRSYEPVKLYGPARDPATGKTQVIAPGRAARDLFYGGAEGALILRPYWNVHPKGGKRVTAALIGIQFLKHNDPFGEGRLSEEAIADGFDSSDDDGGFGDDAGGL